MDPSHGARLATLSVIWNGTKNMTQTALKRAVMPVVRVASGRARSAYDFRNAIPAKLTTLRSSMFHCSYRSSSPRAFGAAFRNV